MIYDGSLNFDTKIDTSGVVNGFKKISTLAKQGANSLAKLTLTGLEKSGEKALTVVSKIANAGLSALTSSISTATVGMTALTGATAGFLTSSIKAGESFESAMSQVIATAGITKDTMVKVNGETVNAYSTLEAKAKELGASTQFSASEVASAFNFMALAGWNVEEQLGAIDGVLDLAAASGLELGTTCDIVTDYLSAFGMETEQAGQMADMMAYAQSNANLSVSNLAESWKNCAANMNANGQSIQTTTALLSKMADQGYKGSEAGTALSAIIRDMSNSMEDGAIKIGDTSIAVADSKGNYRDLTDIIADVEKATSKLSETERTTALSTSFTADSIKGMNLLLNAGADNIKEFEKNLSDMTVIEGYASKTAKTMNDNLEGDMKSLSSALEGVQIAITSQLNPALRNLVQNGTKYLQEFNSALNNGGILKLGEILGDVITEALKDNSNVFNDAFIFGESFINSVIKGIRKNYDKIADNIVYSIKIGLSAVNDNFTDFYNLGFKLVSQIGDGLSENPEFFTNLVNDFITSISSTFTRYSSKLLKSGTTIAKAILQGVSKSTKNVTSDVTTLVNDLVSLFIEEAPAFMEIGTDILVALIQGINDGMAQSDVTVSKVIDTLAQGFKDNGDKLLDSAWILLSALGRGISSNFPQLSQYALELVLALANFIGEHADEVGDGAVDLITSLADTLITEDNLQRLLEISLKLITKFAEGLLSTESTQKLAHTSRQIIQSIGDTLLGETENGENVLNDAVTAGANLGGMLIRGIVNYLFENEDNLFTAFTDLILDLEEYLGNNFLDLGSMAVDAFISGLTGTEFSFEGFGEYLYDEFHSGDFFEHTITNTNDLWGDILKTNNQDIPTGVNINPSEVYDKLNSKMNETVASNTQVSTEIGNYSSSITTSVDGLSNKINEMLNKKSEINLYLYPNSELMAQAQVEGLGIANATSGGHNNGY